MGQQPTEEELFQMISEVDEDMSGAIGKFLYFDYDPFYLILQLSYPLDRLR
jgi:hypothetical protein